MAKLKFNLLKRCPKSGKVVGFNTDKLIGKFLFPFVSILAIAWFLFRVIPKPDRIAYPCQKVAMSLGGTFLTYISALILSYPIFKKISSINKNAAYLSMLAIVAVGFTFIVFARENPKDYVPILTNIEGANNPMGESIGIFPSRVVWVQDFDATSWDGETGNWWTDDNTDQQAANKMMEDALINLTGAKNIKKAWPILFKYINERNGNGNKGYVPGEKIVIKVNLNVTGKPGVAWKNAGYPSPHMANTLVKTLIEVAGVRGENIILADPCRFFNGPLYEKILSNASEEYQKVQFVEKKKQDKPNHVQAVPDTSNLIYFNMPDGSLYKMCFAQCFSDAKYIIDYSLMRPHRVFGITNVAKNHFGSVWDFEKKSFNPSKLHDFALWDYASPNKHRDPHSNPVLLGHETIKNKTVLYLTDALYTAFNQGMSDVVKCSTMNNDWMSSLFMSLDPVALESVCYDFICNEPNLTLNNPSFNGHQDSQIHEAAMANNPPSQTNYDPEQDGTRLESLGTHEHWNNAKEKKYSRNLGKDLGIELVSIQQ